MRDECAPLRSLPLPAAIATLDRGDSRVERSKVRANDQDADAPDAYPRTADRRVLGRVRAVASALLILWGGLWVLFAVVSMVRLGPHLGWNVMFIALPLTSLVCITLVWPRVGGIVLILAGLFAIEFLGHGFTLATVALPAVVLGVAHVLIGLMQPPADPLGS